MNTKIPAASANEASVMFAFSPVLRLRVLLFAGLIVIMSFSARQVAKAANPPSSTTTTLAMASSGNAVASGGSVASGSEVTLTATVTAGSIKLTIGQVNFCDATATYCTDIHLLGTAQLTSAGTAVFRFHPGIGSHSYKAVFAGTPNSATVYAGSTSATATLTVTGTFPTTTSIAASGIAGNYSLTATVTGYINAQGLPAPAGTVSFLDTTNSNVVLASPGLGNAVFAPALANVSNPQTGNEPGTIVAGDFNGDGNLDLAVGVNEISQTVSILLGDGTGNFTAVTKSPITAAGSPVLVQDFNGDGIPDLLLSDLSGSITILLGNGDGTFKVAPGSPFSTNYGVYPIVTADFNGDGIPDLAIAGGVDSKCRCPLFQASEVSGLINHPVAVEAVEKCESRVVCGICKCGGKVVFLTFPPRAFSTALTCFLVSGVKSFPCAL